MMTNIIADIIELCIYSALAPMWFNTLAVTEDIDAYKIFFRLIYPKWLSLKQRIKYYVRLCKQYRHQQQERKRLAIKVLWTN